MNISEHISLMLIDNGFTNTPNSRTEKIINDAKIESKNIFNQAREKILRDINNKKEILEKKINEEVDKAEKEILDFKKKSPEKINKIAIETSADLIKQIMNIIRVLIY